MRKYRVTYLLLLLFVLFCGLWGGTSLSLVLLLLLLILPLLSGAWLYLSSGGLAFTLNGEHRVISGQKAELRVRMTCPRLRPGGRVQLCMKCRNLVFGRTEDSVFLLEPGRGRAKEHRVPLDTEVCGGRKLQVTEVVCYDLLGLFSRKKAVEQEFAYMVCPYEAPMYVSLQRHREREQAGDIYDGKKSGTDVSEVFGLREYREGDPLQSIHWKLSGKMNQLIVREFGRPVNYHTLILMAPALFCEGRELSRQMVSGVYDLGSSFSMALLNQDIAHFIGYLCEGTLRCVPVDSRDSYEQMILQLMDAPAPKNAEEVLLAFLEQQIYRQYTKVVCVTGGVREELARNLSALADLTILQAAEGATGYSGGGKDYTVVRISVENMRRKEHVIPL